MSGETSEPAEASPNVYMKMRSITAIGDTILSETEALINQPGVKKKEAYGSCSVLLGEQEWLIPIFRKLNMYGRRLLMSTGNSFCSLL